MWLAVAFGFAGVLVGGFVFEPVDRLLDALYCTPSGCYSLPLALSGWALAALPMAACLVVPRYAVHLCVFLVSFFSVYFWTAAPDHPWREEVWPLPLSYFLVLLLFAPASWGFSWLFTHSRTARLAIAGACHWVLLAALIIWLA